MVRLLDKLRETYQVIQLGEENIMPFKKLLFYLAVIPACLVITGFQAKAADYHSDDSVQAHIEVAQGHTHRNLTIAKPLDQLGMYRYEEVAKATSLKPLSNNVSVSTLAFWIALYYEEHGEEEGFAVCSLCKCGHSYHYVWCRPTWIDDCTYGWSKHPGIPCDNLSPPPY